MDLSGKKKEDGNDIELKPFDIVQVAGRITDVSETPPILRLDFVRKKEISNLPLRIID